MTKVISPKDPTVLNAVSTALVVPTGRSKAPATIAKEPTAKEVRMLLASIRAFAAAKPKPSDADPFRTKVLPKFEATRADFLALARRTALELSKRLMRPISVGDVRAICPPPATTADGKPMDPRVMGAVFTRKDWVAVEHFRSARTTCHKRHVMLFDRV